MCSYHQLCRCGVVGLLLLAEGAAKCGLRQLSKMTFQGKPYTRKTIRASLRRALSTAGCRPIHRRCVRLDHMHPKALWLLSFWLYSAG